VGISRIVEHILISLLPWLVGGIVGGGLGALCALVGRALFSALPWLRKVSILVPWRGVLMALLLLACSPLLIARLGIGPTTGGVMVGLTMLLLSAAFVGVALLDHWVRPPLAVRLVGTVRTLATASVLVAAVVGAFGGGGLGFAAFQAIRLLEYRLAWTAWLAMVALALLADVLLGAIQLVTAIVAARRERAQPAAAAEAAT
jgi:hypothetical protein